ncbi:MAG: ABC transporter ATP-binding protein [Thermodesulfobacteria bacterium]|nr:ABC transporter ATP-binding protein [Thermodesulfobacteriota bacterium]
MKKSRISKSKAIKKILLLIKPYWYYILASILFSTIASASSGAIAWFVKPLFDKVFLPQNYVYLKYLPIIVLLIFSLRGSAVFLQAYFMKKASYSLGMKIRSKVYEKILHLPISYSTQRTTGDLISRIVNDILILESTVGDISRTFFLELATVIVLIVIAFLRSWQLTLLTFVVFPLVLWSSEFFARKTHKIRHLTQAKLADLTHILTDSFNGLKEIKVYLQEKRMSEYFDNLCEQLFKYFLKLVKYSEGTKFLVTLLSGVAGGIILFYGGYLIKHKIITPGDFFSLFTAILMIFNPLKKLAGAYNRFHDCIVGIERIEDILSLPEEKGGSIKLNNIKQGFSFNKVYFKYPSCEDWALSNINIKLPAGKTIAIIGKSGAGKSTLISLLPRFYDPTQGNITVDGIDLREVELKSLRNLFGIVSQEVIIFNMSIADNIALGKPSATREEIIQAAKLAYAHDFIKDLPQGYDTILGAEGFNLSGGQRQRIAIARAILKNPPVLILDEATSQLDSISEKYIQMALERLMKGRTTIIIAHRLSTVKKADYVVVLDEGKVVCFGTHKELEKNCPHYQRLYEFLEK